MSTLGGYLKRRMDEENITGLALEEATGIPDATISRIRRGTTKKPDPAIVVGLAKAFKEDPVLWLTLAGYPQGDTDDPTEAERILLTQLRAIPNGLELLPLIVRLSPRNVVVALGVLRALQDDPEGNALSD